MTSPVLADCVSPPGVEGQMVYNTTSQVYQFCNGADQWISMAATAGGGGGGGDKAVVISGHSDNSIPACPAGSSPIGCARGPACQSLEETTGILALGGFTTGGVDYNVLMLSPRTELRATSGQSTGTSLNISCSAVKGWGGCFCAAPY